MAENDNTRDDVAAAYDAAVAATETPAPAPEVQPDVVVATPTPVGESDEAKAARLRDEKGRFATKIGDKSPPPKVEEAPKAEAKPTAPSEPTPNPEASKPERQVPRSLPAPLREAWKKLDDVERDYLIKREGEVVRIHNESAQARQAAERLNNEIVTPYSQMFRSEGVEPIQGLKNLATAYATVMSGSPDQRVDVIARLIQAGKVDIALLDARLSGQGALPQQAYRQPDPSQFRDPRLDALLEQQSQRTRQQAAEAVSEVENEEFFDDLRDNMAKLLDAGLVTTAREAYDRAAMFHPGVARVMEQRRAAASIGSTQRAREAASSIKAQPATGVESTSDRGWQGAVEDAYNKAQGR
jgi:hypothetical protein